MTEKSIYSPGYLAQLLQADPRAIQQELDAAKIATALVINGVPHWGGAALFHLRRPEIIRRLQNERIEQ